MFRSGSEVLAILSSAAERLKDLTHTEEAAPLDTSALQITSGVWSLSNPNRVSLRSGDEADCGLGLSNERLPALKRLYERRTLRDHTGSSSGCPVWGGGDAETSMEDRIMGLDTVVSTTGVGLETMDLFLESPDTLLFTFSLLGSDAACEKVTDK